MAPCRVTISTPGMERPIPMMASIAGLAKRCRHHHVWKPVHTERFGQEFPVAEVSGYADHGLGIYMRPQSGIKGDIAANPLLHMPRKPEEVEYDQGRRIESSPRDTPLGLGRKTIAKGNIEI